MSKILIVEDDAYLRRDLKEILIKNNYDVITASSVGEACCCINRQDDIELYVLDICLTDGDGFELCSVIRKKNSNPIIFLSAYDDEEKIVKGLNLGADDYVIKPYRAGELLSRIRANLRRIKDLQERDILKSGDLILDIKQSVVTKNGKDIHLSPIEYDILLKLMDNSERIVKREQLIEMWDNAGNFVEDNTLSVNISRLRNKIGMEFIETIRGFGYRFTAKVQRRYYE